MPDDKLDDLVEGMVQLLKELEGAGGPDAAVGAGAPTATGQAREATASTDSQGTEGDEDAFQRSVRQAMDRLRSSEANPSPSAGAQPSSEDPLETLLRQFGDALGDGIESGLGGGAEGGEAEDTELQGMLETMMRQLMSKDVLYEPLKELSEKVGRSCLAFLSDLTSIIRFFTHALVFPFVSSRRTSLRTLPRSLSPIRNDTNSNKSAYIR